MIPVHHAAWFMYHTVHDVQTAGVIIEISDNLESCPSTTAMIPGQRTKLAS